MTALLTRLRGAGWERALSRLARPAIFGVFDGGTSVLSLIAEYYHLAHLIFPGALALGAVSAIGMGAGEFISDDSDTGLAAAVVIGAATGCGTVAPAMPYLLLGGAPAQAASAGVLAAIGFGIAAVRSRHRGWRRALAETYAVLLLASGAGVACALLVPASTG